MKLSKKLTAALSGGILLVGAVAVGSSGTASADGTTLHRVGGSQVNVGGYATVTASATCPTGEMVTGGGYNIGNPSTAWRVIKDLPTSGTSDTWEVTIQNQGSGTMQLTVDAMCIQV